METMTATNDVSRNATTIKPRLLFMSSKQSGILQSSEDGDQPPIDTSLRSSIDECAAHNNGLGKAEASDRQAKCDLDQAEQVENKFQPINGSSQVDGNKMNVSKEDLIRLLSMLKTELQSKEVALASIKLEQLKRLINPVEISRSSLAKTYMEVQDRLKIQDEQTEISNHDSKFSNDCFSCASNLNQRNTNSSINQNSIDQGNNGPDHESLNMLSTLLELLDRHPLLALPRDSIYCLDYNCNEQSTKNYLNLKIQHLDNLIDQHRRFRYYMNERLKRSEQRYLDLALKLELERNLKLEEERSMNRSSGKSVLLQHIGELKEDLEKEKASKHAIVMTLLNELLDERERNETLNQKLMDLEKKLASNKPKVPVKPAQLLDKQRSQSKGS